MLISINASKNSNMCPKLKIAIALPGTWVHWNMWAAYFVETKTENFISIADHTLSMGPQIFYQFKQVFVIRSEIQSMYYGSVGLDVYSLCFLSVQPPIYESRPDHRIFSPSIPTFCKLLSGNRAARIVAALQPGCEEMKREWGNEERMRKETENEEIERELGNGQRMRK